MSARKSIRQSGAMIITTALFLIMIIGLAAVAFDVGHLLIARNELQNAADAAALAGANCLNKTSAPSLSDCNATVSSSLNWNVAYAKATKAISMNKADGQYLSTGVVTTGYKNLSGTPTDLQPITLSPIGINDRPAVMVQASKESGKNGGPVQLLITPMFGAATVPVKVSAVAVISAPGTVAPATLIPIVINKCLFDKYWDSVAGAPKIFTTSDVDPYGLSTAGQPWEFLIGSAYHYGTCYSGQWTSFNLDVNSQSAVKALIDSGNPSALSVGNNTWIEPGTKTASYYDLDARYPTPLSPPTANASPALNVTIIVVDTTDLTNKGSVPVIAFAGFHIDDIQGGSGKYVQGHFVEGLTAGGSSGNGPYYGTYTPPRLAQ